MCRRAPPPCPPAAPGRRLVARILRARDIRLLAGSGLEATGGAGGTFALLRAVTGDTEASGGTPASVTVTAQAERTATTEGTRSYATRATTIGKTEQALKVIPQSVSVVTRQRMDGQSLTSLSDVVSNTTGLVATQGMGAGSPSGAINFVRKRGQAERTVSLTGKAGSRHRYGVQPRCRRPAVRAPPSSACRAPPSPARTGTGPATTRPASMRTSNIASTTGGC